MDLGETLEAIRPGYDMLIFHDMKTPPATSRSKSLEWKELFIKEYVDGNSDERDDLLFYVKYDEMEEEQTVHVQRKSSRTDFGLLDLSTIWDQTFYLNLVLHEFEYHATCSAITYKPGGDLIHETLMTISHQVYPSPNQRRMDKNKGDCDSAYPNIVFSVDSFEETFSSFRVSKPGQKVAIQLLAVNKRHSVEQVVFLGAVDYSILLEEYTKEKKSETFGSKLKRLSGVHKRVHAASVPPYQFVQVLGPSLKGAAELALCKVTGSRKLAPGLTPDQRPMEQPTAKHNPKLRGVLKLDPPDPQDEEPGHWKAAKAGETCTNTEDDVLDQRNCPGNRCQPSLGPKEHVTAEDMPADEQESGVRVNGACCHDNGSDAGNELTAPEGEDSEPEASSHLPGDKASRFRILKLSKKLKSPPSPAPTRPLYTYLTNIRVPWYHILNDILNGKDKPFL